MGTRETELELLAQMAEVCLLTEGDAYRVARKTMNDLMARFVPYGSVFIHKGYAFLQDQGAGRDAVRILPVFPGK